MATTPGNLGARLWDESTQGSDHTRMPGQPPLILGGPEGVVYAPIGTLCVDEEANVWKKGTEAALNTGWCIVFDTCNIAEMIREQFPS
jgi:hypothetical protein